MLALVASGKSSRETAKELGIAFKTVTTHRYRLQTKLNAHHTADLTRIAMRMGLVQPRPLSAACAIRDTTRLRPPCGYATITAVLVN